MTKEENKLRACPFCGNEAVLHDNENGTYSVRCCLCGAKGPDEPSRLAAKIHWNEPEKFQLSSKIWTD